MSFVLRVALAFVIIFLIEYYFLRKFLKSTNTLFPDIHSKKLYHWSIVVLLIVNIYPLWLLFAWMYSTIAQQGRPEMPESRLFDFLIMFPFWISALVIIQSILFFFILDLIDFIIKPFRKSKRELFNRYKAIAVYMIIGFFVIYIPARVTYDFYSVSVRHVEYTSGVFPDPFKIVFIADIQADKYTNKPRLGKFVNKINEEQPDLVLIAGDIITSGPRYVDLAAAYIGKIESKHGIYSCVGDHDNWVYRGESQRSISIIKEALENNNAAMIDNDNIFINVDMVNIGISFITNTYVTRIAEEKLYSLMNETSGADLRILVVHQPGKDLAETAMENDYNLFLAGHTHGGQISFLFPFKLLTPTLFETRFVRGDFILNGMLKIVNRGLGMSLVPIRYNSTPEITVINVI
jgi:uncharacterized protein